jgi:hypothetical protein
MSKFDRDDIVNYVDSGGDILKSARSANNTTLMRVDPKYDINPNSKQ